MTKKTFGSPRNSVRTKIILNNGDEVTVYGNQKPERLGKIIVVRAEWGHSGFDCFYDVDDVKEWFYEEM